MEESNNVTTQEVIEKIKVNELETIPFYLPGNLGNNLLLKRLSLKNDKLCFIDGLQDTVSSITNFRSFPSIDKGIKTNKAEFGLSHSNIETYETNKLVYLFITFEVEFAFKENSTDSFYKIKNIKFNELIDFQNKLKGQTYHKIHEIYIEEGDIIINFYLQYLNYDIESKEEKFNFIAKVINKTEGCTFTANNMYTDIRLGGCMLVSK